MTFQSQYENRIRNSRTIREFIAESRKYAGLCDDIPEEGVAFALNVKERLEGYADFAEKNGWVTLKQVLSLESMSEAVNRWIGRAEDGESSRNVKHEATG